MVGNEPILAFQVLYIKQYHGIMDTLKLDIHKITDNSNGPMVEGGGCIPSS